MKEIKYRALGKRKFLVFRDVEAETISITRTEGSSDMVFFYFDSDGITTTYVSEEHSEAYFANRGITNTSNRISRVRWMNQRKIEPELVVQASIDFIR